MSVSSLDRSVLSWLRDNASRSFFASGRLGGEFTPQSDAYLIPTNHPFVATSTVLRNFSQQESSLPMPVANLSRYCDCHHFIFCHQEYPFVLP